jgi:diacylglycerol kinase
VYAPLLAAGIVTEDFIHKLANYMAEKKTTKDYRFTTTGLGQAFMKYAAFVPRHSLNTSYYHTAITTFIAISHAHYNVLNYIINNILNASIHGNIDYVLHEYSNYANYINVIDAFPNFFTQAYTRGDALRDLAAMTFTLINARLELLNKDQEQHVRLLSKYTFLMKPPNDLIRDAVRVMLHVSSAVT